MGNMPWGAHFCLFYETKQDLLDTAVPYFKAGLESNEFGIWAVSQPLTIEEATDALRQEIPAIDRHLEDGKIEILRGEDWYLKDQQFDLKRITGGWHEKLLAALARNFDGIRVSGNAFWLDTDHWPNFEAYEHELDATIGGQPMTVLCTYPLTASRANDILDVAQAHQFAILRRRGEWEVVETAAVSTDKHSLTPREREILTWVAKGKSAWEIGKILHITKRTVDQHAQTASRKLGAANRTQAVAIAILHRLIEP